MRLVLSQGAVPVLGGLVTGLGLFVVSARFIRQFMFSLPVVSALTLIVITLAIGLVAALALAVPTRRALSVDPTVALRTE
jgi:ABC-type antimicrobial peptide transport system permease subunit